jgi:hypothetical protein
MKRWLSIVVLAVATGILAVGCGDGSAERHHLSREEKYGIAENVLEEEGFSGSEAEKLRELAEREHVGAKGAVELGGVAKQLGK